MKTFNKNYKHFINKLELGKDDKKLGEEIADKILAYEEKEIYDRLCGDKTLSNLMEFTSLSYLDQMELLISILDNPQFDFRNALLNNKDSDYIKKLVNLIGGRRVKNLPCVDGLRMAPKYKPKDFEKYSLSGEFDKLDFNLKIDLCIYFLTLDMNGGQKDVYTEYLINFNREYREIYEMMEIIAEIIEKNESFLVEQEVINYYNALERDRKINEIFED